MLTKKIPLIVVSYLLCGLVNGQEWQSYTKWNSNLPGNNVQSIAASPGGEDVWFGLGLESLVVGPGSGGRGMAHYQMNSDRWEVFNFQDGLVNDLVTRIAVDDQHVWVGTSIGVSVYDLNRKQFFSIDGLSGNFIQSIEVTDTVAWFGTQNGLGLYLMRNEELQWMTQNEGLISDSIRCLESDGQQLWIGTDSGLQVYDIVLESFILDIGLNLDGQSINAISIDTRYAWVGLDDGIYRMNKSTDEWLYFPDKSRISSLSCNSKDAWIGTDGEGVHHFDYQTDRWETIQTESGGLMSNTITDIEMTPWAIWFGTAQGVSRYKPETPSWESWDEDDIGMDVSLNAVGIDDSYVWVGGAGGVSRYDKSDGQWQFFDVGEVVDIEIDEAGIVIGNSNCVVKRLDKSTGTIISEFQCRGGFTTDLYDLALDGDVIWVGTNSGIYRIAQGQIRMYTIDDYLFWDDGPSADDIAAISVDDQYVWFGPKTNIFGSLPRYEKATGIWKNDIPFDLTFPEILSMAIFKDLVWIGTMGLEEQPGLYIYNKLTNEWETEFVAGEIIFNSVWAVSADPVRDYVWFGTSAGAGLYDFNKRQWYEFTQADGLISNNVQDIEVGGNSVWFATGGGIIQGLGGGVSRFGDTSPPVILYAPFTGARPVKQTITVEAEIYDNLQVIETQLHYRTSNNEDYQTIPLTYQFADVWSATIPSSDVVMDRISYYISAFDGYEYGYHPWRYPTAAPHIVQIYDDIPPSGDISIIPTSGNDFVLNQDTVVVSGYIDGTESVPEILSVHLHQYNSVGMLIVSTEYAVESLALEGTGSFRTFHDDLSFDSLNAEAATIAVQIGVSESDSVQDQTFTSNSVSVLHDTEAPLGFISDPKDNAEVGAIVSVYGTAYDINFNNYTLEYGKGYNPPSWHSILVSDPDEAVVNDLLGNWYTMTLPDTVYAVRLSVWDLANHMTRDTVRVVIDKQPVLASAGGEIISSDGQVKAYIPPHALKMDTPIFINPLFEIPSFSNARISPIGIAYRLEPADTELEKPISIEVSYGLGDIENIESEHQLALFRFDEARSDWTRIGGTVDIQAQSIKTVLHNLGKVAIAEDLSTISDQDVFLDIDCQPRVFSPNGGGYDTKTTISFSLSKASDVTIKVYSLAGRLKRTIVESRQMNAGTNVLEWDGRDENGETMISGLYIVTVQGEGKFAKKTVSILHK